MKPDFQPQKIRSDSSEAKERQAREGELRREMIGDKYKVTKQESIDSKGKIKEALSVLGENSNPENLAKLLDTVFDENIIREKELRNALVDSLLGKISESIGHFMPAEARIDLDSLLNVISTQLQGIERKFNSVDDVYIELKKYESVFEKCGLNFDELAKKFLDELRNYLNETKEK
ncbi:hypothetical protein A2917_02400 [Candidatus Nomurabacteria bacterium RIFCSPLOWO2_01_FULL_42_17]|uniref:Uncharacterized protein n=1 Tax=Candidatus Nomurabacteria bacterium RIFCSPLOWO2_01_FULL_42_17 TaxID=1801780 RepID=A0A1F6XMI6_9BACT|nr:MAG: hypothetical protein A2917_02400 [Candidatus Nomurabacteria bacterium RIFCSPLOWO2_01_FULL_42_17]